MCRSLLGGIAAIALAVVGPGALGCSSENPAMGNAAAGRGGDEGAVDADVAGTRDGAAGGALVLDSGGSGSGPSPESGVGDGDGFSITPVTPDDACSQAVSAYCQRLDECDSGSSTCVALAELCPDYYFGPGSTRTLEAVRSCIPVLRSIPCTDITLGVPPACLAPGTRAGEMECAFDSQCASRDCESGVQQCGHCTTPTKLGESCGGTDHPCEDGAFCNQSGKCELVSTIQHAAEGKKCNLFTSPAVGCIGDLDCVIDGEGGAGTCRRRGVEGQPCGYPIDIPCAHRLDCAIDYEADAFATQGTCQTPRTCGAVTCDTSSYCNRIPDVVCAPLSTQGKPCRQLGGDAPCAPGLTCTVRQSFDAIGTCLPQAQGIGDACEGVNCNYPQRCEGSVCVWLAASSCGGT